MSKICTKCKELKLFNQFHKRGCGYKSACKLCNNARNKNYRMCNKDKQKQYNERNRTQINQQTLTNYYKKKTEPGFLDKRRKSTAKWARSDRGLKLKAAKEGRRRALKFKATPVWVDLEQLKFMYINRPKKHSVDHIIPLKNKLICGLHVPWNLQYLSKADNTRKLNKFDGTYENAAWKEEA